MKRDETTGVVDSRWRQPTKCKMYEANEEIPRGKCDKATEPTLKGLVVEVWLIPMRSVNNTGDYRPAKASTIARAKARHLYM